MLIGIDGGGTKTALCLATEDGKILSQHIGEATNAVDIGLDNCVQRISDQLDILLKDFGGRKAKIKSVYAGIAATANKLTKKTLHEKLVQMLPNAEFVDNNSDAFNALYSESMDGYGITLIAGTGSSTFAVSETGIHQIGGWGYLIDDAGSGFWIGKAALMAAFRDHDGRGEKTLLKEKCEAHLGCPMGESIPRIYEGGKHYIASFARAAFAAFEEGDKIAKSIIQSAADELAHHLRVCLTHMQNFPAVCVASGGVISNDTFFEMVKEALGEDKSKINLLRSEIPQVYGTLCKAALNAGLSITPEFRQNFISNYK